MWYDEDAGAYWRYRGQTWQKRMEGDRWAAMSPPSGLRRIEGVVQDPSVVVVPVIGGQTVIELPPDIFTVLKGDEGDSAYQVAVKNGFAGTEDEWLASLQGPPGPGSPFLVLTQAAYDALPAKDPNVVYIVTAE